MFWPNIFRDCIPTRFLADDGPLTDYGEVYVSQVVLLQGEPFMINYYKQLGGEYINHYYTYLPEYIDCAVTRRVSTDDYKKDVRFLSFILIFSCVLCVSNCCLFTSILNTIYYIFLFEILHFYFITCREK